MLHNDPKSNGLQKDETSHLDDAGRILDHLTQLKKLVLPEESLQSHGYILQSLSGDDLEMKKRCQGCGKSTRSNAIERAKMTGANALQAMSQFRKRASRKKTPDQLKLTELKMALPSEDALEEVENQRPDKDSQPTLKVPEPVLRCRFHDGVLEAKVWSCCGQKPSADPCSGSEHHIPRQYPEGELERFWNIAPTPTPVSFRNVRLAVAIDCEMGTAESGDSELIRVTLVDYFTSEVLLDSLVFPNIPMRDLRSRYSGVTWSELKKARRTRKCILGRENARKAVWQFVGPNTIVVGHSAYHDLIALRWAHKTVVDTYYLDALQPPKLDIKGAGDEKQTSSDSNENQPATTSACGQEPKRAPKRPSPRSLKGLALDKLGREIQTAGKQGHDSLEDAIATRDLARWVVYNAQV